MKRLTTLLAILSLAFAQRVHAQYYSVNYDTRTVAAMVAAFGTEVVAESYYREQADDILKHYTTAEVAAAGIFASKFLEHKALSDLGIWCSSTENYYYRRIYRMVAEKIMPKIWMVAKLMLRSPQTAIHWGSYLMKVCDDTKSLCMQFESIVTNSTLTFSDIVFLEINREIAPLLRLSELGGVDWHRMLDDMARGPGNLSREKLQSDIDNLYNMGVGLATAGIAGLGDALLPQSMFHELLNGKVSEIAALYDHYADIYEQAERGIGNMLLDRIGGEENVAGLFEAGAYDLAGWMSDYMGEETGNYYTQRWYIARREQGSTALCDYYPPTDDNSILYGGEWMRLETTDPGFYPNASQREQVLANSERHAGWSRSRVQQLNSRNDGYTYTIDYWMNAYIINRSGRQTKKAYAYEIHVKQSWNRVEVIYEEVFDSYTMDLNTFKAVLNARLSEFNDNEEDYTYYIASDARNYYQATDAARLQGCESVTISVTCSDGATLGQGSTQYKCRGCGSSLNAHSKECAMQTTVAENELDFSELDAMIQEADNRVVAIQSQIEALEAENAALLKKIAEASVEDAAAYRQQYNANRTRIGELNGELAEWQKKQSEYADAKQEAAGDNAEHQRRHHIPGDPLHRAETEVFPRNKDSQGHPANQLGVDHGVHRHPCGRRADTRPGPVGRGENQDGKRPYRGDRPGASVVQNHDGVRPHRSAGRDPDRGRAPPVVVERPARNRPRGGQPPHENLRRPRVAGKNDALQAEHYRRAEGCTAAGYGPGAQADARGRVSRPLGGQRAEPAEPCGQKGGAPMKRNLLITAVLLALLPRVAQAQWTFDIVSVEAYINDHKKQRSLLLARSTLEYSNQLLHEYSRKEVGGYKELNVDLDRYTRAFDVIDVMYQSLRTALNVKSTYTAVSDRIGDYKRLLEDFNEKVVKRGRIDPADALIIKINERAIRDIAHDGEQLYRSVSDLVLYVTGAAACSTSDLLMVLEGVNRSLDDIERHLNRAYIETWRYIQVRIGYWKEKIYRTRSIREIADDAFGRWRGAGRLDY